MSEVIIQPQVFEASSKEQLVQLLIRTLPRDWEGVYQQLEVHRSTTLSAGPYEAMTGETTMPAVVPEGAVEGTPSAERSFSLDGLELELEIDGAPFSYTFEGPNPVLLSDVVSQLQAAGTTIYTAFSTDEGEIALATVNKGSSSSLKVIGGDAAAILGLPLDSPDNFSRGRGAHLLLIPDQQEYKFSDFFGARDYWYKTRYRDVFSGAVSDFSVPFSARSAGVGLPGGYVVTAYLELVQADGRPLRNRLIQLYTPTPERSIEGKLVVGARQVCHTDEKGRAEFSVVRGVKYTLAIPGTDIIREIVAPEDPDITSFNLLDGQVGSEDDAFKVQIPDVVFAERRSL